MATFLVVSGFLIFLAWLFVEAKKGSDSLDDLRRGKFGEFEIADLEHMVSSILAFDSTHERIAFLGVEVPSSSVRSGQPIAKTTLSFVCGYADIDKVIAFVDDENVVARFRFSREIPPGNQGREISFVGSARLGDLLRKELPRLVEQRAGIFEETMRRG